MITSDTVKESVLASNKTYFPVRKCSMCGYGLSYQVKDDNLYFDPGCDCTSGGHLERRSWEYLVEWINMQSNDKARKDLMSLFNINDQKEK